jgi:hypothetical protein
MIGREGVERRRQPPDHRLLVYRGGARVWNKWAHWSGEQAGCHAPDSLRDQIRRTVTEIGHDPEQRVGADPPEGVLASPRHLTDLPQFKVAMGATWRLTSLTPYEVTRRGERDL